MGNYFNKMNLGKVKSLIFRYKLKEVYYLIREKLSEPYRDYGNYVYKYLPDERELQQQRKEERTLSYRPLVSVVVPTYETEEFFLKEMIDSVISQTYTNWQLCIADGSKSDKVKQFVDNYYAAEERISYKKLDKNGGISENTNRGFEIAQGEYIALLDHDDLLVSSALFEVVKRLNETKADMLYSDEDKISADSTEYMTPHFKLDYNRELLMSYNYICHFLVLSKELLERVGYLDSRYDGAQDYDLVLRCSEKAEKIEHIPKILYHWRVHSGSTAGNASNKNYAYEAGIKAVEAALMRRGFKGQVIASPSQRFCQIEYESPQDFTIGIREHGKAVKGYEQVRSNLERDICKMGGKVIWNYEDSENVDYVLDISRRVKEITEGGISTLLGNCARENVSRVGAKVIEKGKIKHCGYRLKNGKLQPRYAGISRNFHGYFNRAWVAAEVDDLDNIFVVTKKNTKDGCLIVEPAVCVKVAN